MGLFTGIDKASYSENGVFFVPGNYVVEVLKLKAGTTRKKIDFFLAECRILQSSNPERPVGSKATWFVSIIPDTSALGSIKNFIAIANDVDEKDVDDLSAEMVVSDAQPIAGTFLRATATNLKTRAGNDFTKVSWEKYTGSVEEANVLRANALGK